MGEGEHIPAITEHRETNGYLEGWDRHEGRWVPLVPPKPGAPPAVLARWARVRDAELARLGAAQPCEPSGRRGTVSIRRDRRDYKAGYQSGYKAGYRAALRKHAIGE